MVSYCDNISGVEMLKFETGWEYLMLAKAP